MHMASTALKRALDLPPESVQRLSSILSQARRTVGFPVTSDPRAFLRECDRRHLDHATVTHLVAKVDDPQANAITETLIDKPIVRKVDPPPRKRGPRAGKKPSIRARHASESRLLPRIIRLKVDTNPKKGASAERFALYKDGMIVQNYINAGGRLADIRWDADRGYIEIEGGLD